MSEEKLKGGSDFAAYRRLAAWHAAMDLAVACYEASAGFPSREWFGLAIQIRRAAVSVPSNIAEGYSRRSRAAYLHHLGIALGSHAELETQIELARRLGFLDLLQASNLSERTRCAGRLLTALRRSLVSERSSQSPSPESPVPDSKSGERS